MDDVNIAVLFISQFGQNPQLSRVVHAYTEENINKDHNFEVLSRNVNKFETR